MLQDTKAIANVFISAGKNKIPEMNAIKLQKLIYYCHCWHLAITKMPLLSESVEARDYGIVIPSIYLALRHDGLAELKTLFQEFHTESGQWSEPFLDPHSFAMELVRKIIAVYGQMTTVEISNMTHLPDSPWVNCEKSRESVIDEKQITKYFSSLVIAQSQKSGQNFFNISMADIRLETEHPDNTPDFITKKELAEYKKSARDLQYDKPKRMWKTVVKQSVCWNNLTNQGFMRLLLEDSVEYNVCIRSLREMRTILNIFQNEREVKYDIASGVVASEWKTIKNK